MSETSGPILLRCVLTLSLIFPTVFKPIDIHKFTHQESVVEWGRRSAPLKLNLSINFCARVFRWAPLVCFCVFEFRSNSDSLSTHQRLDSLFSFPRLLSLTLCSQSKSYFNSSSNITYTQPGRPLTAAVRLIKGSECKLKLKINVWALLPSVNGS